MLRIGPGFAMIDKKRVLSACPNAFCAFSSGLKSQENLTPSKNGTTMTVGVCAICIAQFKCYLPTPEQALWEVKTWFYVHRCIKRRFRKERGLEKITNFSHFCRCLFPSTTSDRKGFNTCFVSLRPGHPRPLLVSLKSLFICRLRMPMSTSH